MKIKKIILLNGSEIYFNIENICDIRQDPMSDNYTLIQLTQGIHKVNLSVDEVLKLIGANNVL